MTRPNELPQDQTPWTAHYPDGVPVDVDVPEGGLATLLDDAAANFPERPALHFEGRTLTYRELDAMSWRVAAALHASGVTPGDRVGLILPNCPQAAAVFFGALRLGAVVVQNNPLYTERELAHQLADAGVKAVVCLDLAYERVKAARERVPTLETLIVTSVLDELAPLKRMLAPLTRAGREARAPVGRDEPVERWRRWLRAARPRPPEETVARPDLDDLALLQYTGGTTGLSKGVMLSHRNLRANVEQVYLWVTDVQPGREVLMGVLPFFHVYGLTTVLLFGVRSGAATVLFPRFSRDKVLAAVDRYRPTLFPGVPTMYVALNSAPDLDRHDLSSIRACISGAAPLPAEVAAEFEAHAGGRVVEGYGLTEASPVTHANPLVGERRAGMIGMPVPGTIARVVDPEQPGRALPPGETGELQVRGPQVMQGYWQQPEETAEVLQDGWLLTGDMAVMDRDGFFQIVDRKKDLILVGGMNVYPREVEEVLYTHPKVQEACVAGIPDRFHGEVVAAYVVARQGEKLTGEELRAFAAERLTKHKVPRVFELRDELPKTLIGKILRRKLVEEAERRQSETDTAAS